MSFLPGNFALYLTAISLLCLAGAGTSPVVFTRLVAAHFEVHRGLALGLLLSGTGVAAALAPAFFTPLIDAQGWRAGYRLLATIVIAAFPIVLVGLGRHGGLPSNRGLASRPDRTSPSDFIVLFRDGRFRLMLLSFFSLALGIGGLVVHFVPMLLDGGMDAATAGWTAGLVGIAVIFGRICAGALIDRFHAPFVAAALLLAAAAGCALLVNGGTHVAGFAALLIGLALGGEVDLIGFLVARYIGLAAYGSAYGILYGAFVAGASIGPFVVGLSFDLTGSYRLALIGGALLLSSAALLLSRLGPYPFEGGLHGH